MSAETELYAALAAAPALAALVGTRIYPDAIPEDKDLPAVVFSRTDTYPIVTVHGYLVAENARLQITAWSDSRTKSEAVADAAVAAIAPAGQQFISRSSHYDGESGLFATSLEYDWFISF